MVFDSNCDLMLLLFIQVMDLCDEYLPQPKDAGFDEHIITPFVAGHQQRLVDYQVRYGGGGGGGGRG